MKVTLIDNGEEVRAFSLSHRQVPSWWAAVTVNASTTLVVTFPATVDAALTSLSSLTFTQVTVGSGIPSETQLRSLITVPIDRRAPDV